MSPQHPTSSLSTHRIAAFVAILFFATLQVNNHKVLFRSSTGDADTNAAWFGWAPDDFREVNPKRKMTMMERRERRKKQRAKARKNRKGKDDKHTKKKKKKKRSQRFMATNYTSDFEPLPWTLPKPTPIRYQTSEKFMADYIAAKRRHNVPLPWEQREKYAGKPVTLPLPIISLNFPKSATLTMKTYFDCGGITSVHTSTQDGRIAVCMMENQMADRPPMDRCNTHKVRHGEGQHDIVPIDFISDIGLQGPPCYYPAVHDGGLENIAKHYPNATILLVTRNPVKWVKSISKWGSLVVRLKKYCGFHGDPEFSGKHHNAMNTRYWNKLYRSLGNSKVEYWVNFYQSHTQKIREFAMKHLSLTYVEVELENPRMAEILEEYTSVSRSCVMDCHPGPKWIRENNATSRCHPVGENPAHMNANPVVNDEEGEESENEGEIENEDVEDEEEIDDEDGDVDNEEDDDAEEDVSEENEE